MFPVPQFDRQLSRGFVCLELRVVDLRITLHHYELGLDFIWPGTQWCGVIQRLWNWRIITEIIMCLKTWGTMNWLTKKQSSHCIYLIIYLLRLNDRWKAALSPSAFNTWSAVRSSVAIPPSQGHCCWWINTPNSTTWLRLLGQDKCSPWRVTGRQEHRVDLGSDVTIFRVNILD